MNIYKIYAQKYLANSLIFEQIKIVLFQKLKISVKVTCQNSNRRITFKNQNTKTDFHIILFNVGGIEFALKFSYFATKIMRK